MPRGWPRLSAVSKTSTFRLTVMFGMAGVMGVLLALLLVYSLTANDLDVRVDQILRSEMAHLEEVPPANLPEVIERSVGSGSRFGHYGLLSAGGRWLAGDLGASPPEAIGTPYYRDTGADVRAPLRILAKRQPDGRVIIVGRDISLLPALRDHVLLMLLVTGFVVVPLLLLTGLALSLGPLRRVDRLQRVAAEIAGGRLDARMPIEGRGDELDLFAETVNHMIGEVEGSMEQVKSVTDAIAHDLRTPLTRVRNQLYRAARAPDMPPAGTSRIEAAMDGLDTVLARFAALLRISELEAGHRRQGFGAVGIDGLVDVVIDLYAPLAEEQGVRLLSGTVMHAVLFCDAQLMVEALSNLVDNAIKFSPAGGDVVVSVICGEAEREGDVVIEVRDDGPGIPPEQVEAVVRRFDRGAASPAVPGSGLGLSVVAAIAHLHQYTLELAASRPVAGGDGDAGRSGGLAARLHARAFGGKGADGAL
ncbi:sensor histidine kinase [Novosphingobium pituita]|uniref:histidine kinase n=1 Tax=Novosphingobium pituita TaxID=3056842 RepID=A0ABQ6P5E2_9SPHN|nr:HAMP domain-containing sensor histidine kinase [Novosphingobium sp. IK01]GMM60031.1 HAMP domain-containing sensor histidine kinase [Novosphingobium sp. IK01]